MQDGVLKHMQLNFIKEKLKRGSYMITVLRLGHRQKRDERVSTHCGLVSRAFGASAIVYSGEKDDKIVDTITDVTERWGGPFSARYEENWRSFIKKFRGTKIHLTMYGMPLKKHIGKIRKSRNLLIIIGSEKVPPEVYHLVEYNIAVYSQPHSEIAALAVLLHELNRKEKPFRKAKIKIIPQPKGKKTIVKK